MLLTMLPALSSNNLAVQYQRTMLTYTRPNRIWLTYKNRFMDRGSNSGPADDIKSLLKSELGIVSKYCAKYLDIYGVVLWFEMI